MSDPRPVVGVFDSGVGGLSVWRALREALPHAHLSYLADNAWAPYGERPAEALQERLLALVRDWREREPLHLLVLACNTATAVGIDALRAGHPDLPIVGIEPAIRPALAATRSGQVGVVATRATLGSARYRALRGACMASAAPGAAVHERAADGLAHAIERGDETGAEALCRRHLRALLDEAPDIDTLVLGCTHYPLVLPCWRAACGERPLTLIDPAEAVARRVLNVLADAAAVPGAASMGDAVWRCTGQPEALARATRQWLGLSPVVEPIQS
ncbi:MAG: glutamate racemase [Hydrogenophaga sp.]|uniref:glutamate racemase n=1 Tax=Hydrogenophaga sp. TaxID=1904254 RepID=UPI00169BB265|nr:glutamate racemase [Hydrogenophaga sp.]NIM41589.1 glutamate racemase [Hydrogenophaga sp.]NIN26897.1 glutamate racemase [Hydrogenophaga sp.]NIN31598.1 glutamate racemase [Hydrogenophaga sp.]NIN55832.1 glutamate racemase [Hydrogenophaga sp.]NIO51631.1 glutamate racemase [Hydrogenophaga sp.]